MAIKKTETPSEDLVFAPDQFRFTAEFSPVHMIFTDADGVIVYANPAAEKITGYSRREMINKPLRQWGGEMPKEFYDRLWQTIAVEKKVFHDDLVQTRMDGTLYTAEIWISPVMTDGKTVSGFVGVEIDVSDRKKLLGDIQESEHRFRQITENVKETFFLMDSKTYEIFYQSPAFELIWGIPVEDAYKNSKLWLEAVFEEDRPLFMKFLENGSGGKEAVIEFRLQWSDKTILWVRGRVYPVLDDSGKIYRLAGFFEDISKEKEQSTALAKSLDRARSIFNSQNDAVFVHSNDRVIEDINKAAETMFGYTFSEVIGQSTEILHVDHDHFEQFGKAAYWDEQVIVEREFEWDLRRKNGEVFPVEFSFSPLKNEAGEQTGLVVVIRDISNRKRNELQIKESDVLKNKFIQIVSHQFRTPLNAIRWNLEALMGDTLGALKPEQKEFIRITHNANVEIIERVGDLLIAMDIEEKRIQIEKSEASLESLLASVVGTFKLRCDARGVLLSYQPPKEILPVVLIDADKIRTVFEKLVLNAVNYSLSKGTITASLIQNEATIRFELSDTGVGIPLAEQPRIFTRFYRASNASPLIPDASGLGLYLAKYFIEQHGGTIGFTSQEGKGSTFWFELPV